MGKKKKRFIDYDYDEVFDTPIDLLEESAIVQALEKRDITSIYATKTIKSGNQLEVEIYPEFTKKKAITKNGRFQKHKDIQNNLNDKNSRKSFIRLVNTNFTKKDYYITLTYEDKHLPEDMKEAMNNIRNYIRRINRLRKKKGLENCKYVYVTEWKKGDKGIRCHHHAIIEGGISMDEIESTWNKGRRNNIRRYDPTEEDGGTGLANYLMKDPQGNKRWVSSKNLKKPVIRKNHQDFSNKKVKKMVADTAIISGVMSNKYKAEFKEVEIKYNHFNNKWYLYVKMYFKE